MCDRLKLLLKTINPKKEEGMSMETKRVFEALAEDMGDISVKQAEMDEKINRLLDDKVEQKKINTILLEKLTKIENKLEVDQLEQKAFMFDKISQFIHNKWVWRVLIALILLGGVGIAHFVDKSSNIAEIAGAMKK
ncbi:MAG: hypothetical protein K2M23_00065 [Alphaproteobacteria bacterium]|nr:hypothetical protein [Alphaproteobacteria bacterium]